MGHTSCTLSVYTSFLNKHFVVFELVKMEPLETKPLCDSEKERNSTTLAKSLLAFGLLLFAVICFCASLACVQVLGKAIPENELNAFRFGTLFLVMIFVNAYRDWDIKIARSDIPNLIIYVMSFNFNNLFIFTAGIYIPLGDLGVIGNCAVLILTIIGSICIKSERQLPVYVGCFVAIIGMLFILQPEFMFKNAGLPPPPEVNWKSPCVKQNLDGDDIVRTNSMLEVFLDLPGEVLGNLCLFGYALNYVTMTFLGKRLVKTYSPCTITFWGGLSGTVLSLVLMMLTETPTFPSSGFCIGLILTHCVTAATNTILWPFCLQYLSASVATMTHTSEVIVLMILQYTILKPVMPGLGNWLEIFGSVLCFFGLIGGPLWQIIRQRYETKSE